MLIISMRVMHGSGIRGGCIDSILIEYSINNTDGIHCG